MQHTTLDVTGMKCDGCVKSVTSALGDVEGVRAVEVSLAEERAELDVDDRVTVGTLVAAVEEAGFGAKPAG